MPDLATRLHHSCFPQPSPGSSVWRYMPLAKFISLVQTETLFLSRLDLMADPHEAANPVLLLDQRSELNRFSGSPALYNTLMSEHSRRARLATFVNCWALSEFESEALWKLFAVDGDGIAINTTYQALVDTIEPDDELYLGSITYIDYEKESFPDGEPMYPVMHKRNSFCHEHEVRLVKHFPQYLDASSAPPPGVSVSINIDALIKRLYVSPYCPKWYYETVKGIVGRLTPSLEPRIKWSPMRIAPRF
jgi:hypothetical protein